MIRETRCVSRRGYALVAVLWAVTLLGGVTLIAGGEARSALLEASHRTRQLQGRWLAEGCSQQLAAFLEAEFPEESNSNARSRRWSHLDDVVDSIGSRALGDRCSVRVEAGQLGLPVALIDSVLLARVLAAGSAGEGRHAETVDCVLDWQDADDVERVMGAELAWYRARTLPPPRNAPVTNPRELMDACGVRELDSASTAALLGALSGELGAVSLSHGSIRALQALLGLDDAGAAFLDSLRTRRRDAAAPTAQPLTVAEASSALARFGHRVAPHTDSIPLIDAPDSWRVLIVVADRGNARSEVPVQLECMLRLSGGRPHITRRRWML